jgi:hypothetical protein
MSDNSQSSIRSDLTSGRSFEDLAASRREWIETVLRVWCRSASLKELKKAEVEWFDVAGRADQNATLWTWAWERFPAVVHPEMAGVHETHAVQVQLKSGVQLSGFPDARRSQKGQLVLIGTDSTGAMIIHDAVSIDDVQSIARVECS